MNSRIIFVTTNKPMEEIWQTLPNDLTRHILSFLDDIDIRLEFKITPRRLPKSTLEFRKGKLFITRNSHMYTIGIKLSDDVLYMIHINKTNWSMIKSQNRYYWYFNKDLDKTDPDRNTGPFLLHSRKYVYED